VTDDDEPFGSQSTLGADLARAAGGKLASQGMEAEQQRAFRLRVKQWAEARGFAARDSELFVRAEEIEVVVRLYEMTEETAVVRANAQMPSSHTFSVEPARRSWTDALRKKLGGKRPTIEPGFDEKFQVRTDDEGATRQILGEDARKLLLTLDAWSRTTYAEGKIEVRLDTPALAGRHLLRATELAVALARARVSTTAYR
jgi:hypothetical protein